MDIQNKVSNYLKESFTSDLKAGFITDVIAGMLVAATGGSRYSITDQPVR
ncbi:MAG: hypothetical protein SCH66_13300 [Methanolobus sp.]|nr:hypothetical protein [Methanolobus sp.]